MLSENEIEAVEYLKSEINYNKQRIEEIENKNDISLIGLGTIHDAYKLQNCQYLILLNLINRLEKGNKKLKDNNKSLLKKLRNRIKEFAILNRIIKEKDKQITELNEYLERISKNLDNVAIDQIPIAISELKYKNELKDKQIDLMAISILVKKIGDYPCGYKQDCIKSDKEYRDIHCKDCIKQYFENKAKKGE